jgi:oligopeptide transport system substrate-binding protein
MMSGTYYYIFNTQSPPFNNVPLRRAFALAINRKEIVDNITQGEQLPATGLVPPTMWKEQIDYFQDADVKEARACFAHALKEMGITAAELPTLTLSYNTMSSHHKIAQAIQEQWFQAFGIRVKLENKEWKVFLSELSHGQFQIARLGGVANINDPTEFLDVYRYANSSNNRARWHNEKFTQLLERAETISDAKERLEILREAEQILIDEMPLAPIYYYKGIYLKKPYVKGVYLSEISDIDFKSAYLEKE